MKNILALLISVHCFSVFAYSKERIYIENSSKSVSEKEAIVILVGFGSKIQGTKKIADYFFNKGYDVFIPDYISRKSIEGCVENLEKFIVKNHIKQYQSLHVFSYIIGSWTLNNWIEKNPDNNISTIIYDRSPLQERAPYALVKDLPGLMRITSGKIMKEFSNTKYSPIESEKIFIGIIIESKPTKLIRKHKESALSLGPINWDVKNLNQKYTDKFYTWLNHDEMYTRFDISGSEIFHFIKNHAFTEAAKREPFSDDPFVNLNSIK